MLIPILFWKYVGHDAYAEFDAVHNVRVTNQTCAELRNSSIWRLSLMPMSHMGAPGYVLLTYQLSKYKNSGTWFPVTSVASLTVALFGKKLIEPFLELHDIGRAQRPYHDDLSPSFQKQLITKDWNRNHQGRISGHVMSVVRFNVVVCHFVWMMRKHATLRQRTAMYTILAMIFAWSFMILKETYTDKYHYGHQMVFGMLVQVASIGSECAVATVFSFINYT